MHRLRFGTTLQVPGVPPASRARDSFSNSWRNGPPGCLQHRVTDTAKIDAQIHSPALELHLHFLQSSQIPLDIVPLQLLPLAERAMSAGDSGSA